MNEGGEETVVDLKNPIDYEMLEDEICQHERESVDRALAFLNESIRTWERSTGRGYLLVLVPHSREEDVHISMHGDPISTPSEKNLLPTITKFLRLRKS